MSALKTFIIYAHEDAFYKNELIKFLKHLEKKDKIKIWTDVEILPGEVWDESIKLRLNEADIILPLVSVDFYNSNYIQDIEFKLAKERRDRGEALLIPILAKQCPWKSYEIISELQALPSDGQPIDSFASTNVAFTKIADALEEMADKLRARRMESQKLVLEAEREAAEQKAIIEAKRAEAERKAREEAESKYNEASSEVITERELRMNLEAMIDIANKRKTLARIFIVGIVSLLLITFYFALESYQKQRSLEAKNNELIAETGRYSGDYTGKTDSINLLVKKIKLEEDNHKKLKKACFEWAFELASIDSLAYRRYDEKKQMERANLFLNKTLYKMVDRKEDIKIEIDKLAPKK